MTKVMISLPTSLLIFLAIELMDMRRKDPTAFKQRFEAYKNGKSVKEIYDAGYIKEPVITPDPLYNEYINSLPDNQRLTPESLYRSHRYWEFNDKPKNFAEAIGKGMFEYNTGDNSWHASSAALNKNTGEYEFMKPNWHSTKMYEDAWYYSKGGELFRNRYTKKAGVAYDKYVPKYRNDRLPRYGDGLAPTTTYSDDDALSYIIALENPNKVGWDSNKKVWRVPTAKGFDHNAIAYGLDIREKHNPYVYNFLKSKGRLNDPWLTDSEARSLAMKSYRSKDETVAKAMDIAKGKVSDRGYLVLRGMAWHGDPMKKLLDEDTVTGKAFRRAIAEGDADLNTVFDAYYLHPANAKKYAERIKADAKYRPLALFVKLDGKVLKIDWNKLVPQWQPPKLQIPHNTEYPIVNTAPESISSWSGADSPSKGPRILSILDTMLQLQNILNLFGLHPVTSSRSILPPLSKLMPSLDELMAEQQLDYIKDILNIENPVKDALYHAKNGKLSGYEDGTGLADFIKNRLYTNVDPHDYNIPKAIFLFLGGEREYRSGMKEALWAKYLGRDTYNDYVGEKSVDDWIIPAVYSPTTGKSTYTAYRLNPAKFNNSHAGSAGGPLSDENIRAYFRRRAELGKNNFTTDDGFPNSGMGYYTMGSGQDENGRYISYYDDWDINPFHGKTALSWTKILPKALTDKADILQGTLKTNPYTLYDRRYLTDEEWQALGGYKNGKLPYFSDGKSPIHIKPANRGKFTALKKRTGHSASWFKKNGTPAQKKMAVFALNAKKWKH